MYGYIYKTTNLVNGKIYIGQHKAETFDKYYYGSGWVIKEAFKKYKPKRINFKCEVLEWCETKDQISECEKYWISFYNAKDPKIGYNLNEGGNGCHYGGTGMAGKVKIIKDTETKFINLVELESYQQLGWALIDKAESKRKSRKKWKKENKDKVKAQKKAWKKKHPENRYHKKHKDDPDYQAKVKAQNAKYYVEHKEQLKQYYKEYYKDSKHRKAHNKSSKKSRLKKADKI